MEQQLQTQTLQVQSQNSLTSLTAKEQCRPLLAKLQEDYPKIKNEQVQVIDGTINYLFALLNIQFKPEERLYRDAQTLVLSEFLQDRFKHLTLEEVKTAFKMYAAKELPQLKTFRILDCISLDEVLNAFVEHRNQNLHIYNLKKINNTQNLIGFKPSNEEKLKISNLNRKILFESLKSNEIDYSAFIYYNQLKNKINLSQEQVLELYNSGLKKHERELQQEAFKNPLKKIDLQSFQTELKSKKWNPIIIQKSQSVAVCNYLKKFKNFDEFLNEFED